MEEKDKKYVIDIAVAASDRDPEIAARTALDLAFDPDLANKLKAYHAEQEAKMDELLASNAEAVDRIMQKKLEHAANKVVIEG